MDFLESDYSLCFNHSLTSVQDIYFIFSEGELKRSLSPFPAPVSDSYWFITF